MSNPIKEWGKIFWALGQDQVCDLCGGPIPKGTKPMYSFKVVQDRPLPLKVKFIYRCSLCTMEGRQ